MRLARPLSALALLGSATLLSLPAAAEAKAQFAGLSCGLQTSQTGDEVQRGQTGVVTGGPLVVTVDGAPAGAVLRCSVQRFEPTYGTGPVVAEAWADGTGVVYLPPTSVRFEVYPGEPIYVCSEMWVGGSRLYRLDNDPARDGDQCATSRPQPTPTGNGYSEPPNIWVEQCFDGEVAGQPYHACVPWPDPS